MRCLSSFRRKRREDDDSAGSSDFRLSATLTAGQTYYIVVGYYRYSIGDCKTTILKGTDLPNDVYYIKNRSSGKYVDIVGPYEQEWIHQWYAHDGYQELWEIQRQSDGYYTIRSLFEYQYYIGISSTEVGVDNITLHSSVSADTKWKIFETSSGEYIFEPVTAPGTVLSAPNDAAGTWLQTDNLCQVTTENNKWCFVKTLLFIVNYYDSSFSENSELLANIPLANDFTQLVYSEVFNIGIYMDGTESYRATKVDECLSGRNSPCTCYSNCYPNHHKNVDVLVEQLYASSREENHLYMFWMNRARDIFCYENLEGEHEPYVDAIASTNLTMPEVMLTLHVGGEDSQTRLACMSITLAHETAHTFFFRDVYDRAGHSMDSEETICIMGALLGDSYEFYEKVINGLVDPFCPQCKENLSSNISNANASNNS